MPREISEAARASYAEAGRKGAAARYGRLLPPVPTPEGWHVKAGRSGWVVVSPEGVDTYRTVRGNIQAWHDAQALVLLLNRRRKESPTDGSLTPDQAPGRVPPAVPAGAGAADRSGAIPDANRP